MSPVLPLRLSGILRTLSRPGEAGRQSRTCREKKAEERVCGRSADEFGSTLRGLSAAHGKSLSVPRRGGFLSPKGRQETLRFPAVFQRESRSWVSRLEVSAAGIRTRPAGTKKRHSGPPTTPWFHGSCPATGPLSASFAGQSRPALFHGTVIRLSTPGRCRRMKSPGTLCRSPPARKRPCTPRKPGDMSGTGPVPSVQCRKGGVSRQQGLVVAKRKGGATRLQELWVGP